VSRRKIILLGVVVACAATGAALALTFGGHEASDKGSHHTALIALLPIYTSLIAILASRRRSNACANEKNNG